MNGNFSLLVKPASYCCNLRCSYCFYFGKRELFGERELRMDGRTLSTMIEKFIALGLPVSSFGWQGGEPTLMGLDFYRRAVELQRQFAKPGQRVANALQTNGTLLDDEWGSFLHVNKFLVGLSVDGPEGVHDKSRLRADGRGSHADVMRGMEALKRNGVEFNVLTLVSTANQERPLEVYNYLKSLGVLHHQYIECVEFSGDGSLAPFSVDPLKWGQFLCAIFDEWFKADTRTVSVRLFDSILVKLLDKAANACMLGTDCRQYFVVEHNGDVFPCDFHVKPEWRLGNVAANSFEELYESELYRKFGARKRELSAACKSCEFLGLCAGCCPKNRPGAPASQSALCAGWKLFYGHTLERFKELAAEVAKERKSAARRRTAGSAPPDRNAPCPCGSGRKYKKCCGS